MPDFGIERALVLFRQAAPVPLIMREVCGHTPLTEERQWRVWNEVSAGACLHRLHHEAGR